MSDLLEQVKRQQEAEARLVALGRLEDMKAKERTTRIQLDAICKNMIDLFSPMDAGMTYVSRIDLDRLDVHTTDIKRKLKELKKLETDMAVLRSQIGKESE